MKTKEQIKEEVKDKENKDKKKIDYFSSSKTSQKTTILDVSPYGTGDGQSVQGVGEVESGKVAKTKEQIKEDVKDKGKIDYFSKDNQRKKNQIFFGPEEQTKKSEDETIIEPKVVVTEVEPKKVISVDKLFFQQYGTNGGQSVQGVGEVENGKVVKTKEQINQIYGPEKELYYKEKYKTVNKYEIEEMLDEYKKSEEEYNKKSKEINDMKKLVVDDFIKKESKLSDSQKILDDLEKQLTRISEKEKIRTKDVREYDKIYSQYEKEFEKYKKYYKDYGESMSEYNKLSKDIDLLGKDYDKLLEKQKEINVAKKSYENIVNFNKEFSPETISKTINIKKSVISEKFKPFSDKRFDIDKGIKSSKLKELSSGETMSAFDYTAIDQSRPDVYNLKTKEFKKLKTEDLYKELEEKRLRVIESKEKELLKDVKDYYDPSLSIVKTIKKDYEKKIKPYEDWEDKKIKESIYAATGQTRTDLTDFDKEESTFIKDQEFVEIKKNLGLKELDKKEEFNPEKITSKVSKEIKKISSGSYSSDKAPANRFETGLEVGGAFIENTLKVTSEKITLDSAKSKNKFRKTTSFAVATGAQFFGDVGSILRLPYSASSGTPSDISTKRREYDTGYEFGALAVDLALTGKEIYKGAKTIISQKKAQKKFISEIDDILDSINVKKIKGKEKKKIISSIIEPETESSTKKILDKFSKQEESLVFKKNKFSFKDDIVKDKRLGLLQTDDFGKTKYKGIVESPIQDVTQKKYYDYYTEFASLSGKEKGLKIGDTTYGVFDSDSGKIFYQIKDNKIKGQVVTSQDDILLKFSEKIPETKVDIGQIRKSKITSGWFEQDDFLKKTDIFSKKQKGAIFSDKNRFRTFDVSEGKTIRTKVEGYDIDYIDSELGNIFKKQKIKISKPTSKDIIDIDDIIELKVQSPKGEKIFGTQTKGTKTIVQQETDDFFSLTISPKKKIKSKFESFKDDIFKKNKKASILQTEIIDDLEEEEVISKLIQQDQKKVKSFEPKIKTEETLFKTDIDDVLSVLEKPKIKVKSKLVSPTTVLGFETFKISKKFFENNKNFKNKPQSIYKTEKSLNKLPQTAKIINNLVEPTSSSKFKSDTLTKSKMDFSTKTKSISKPIAEIKMPAFDFPTFPTFKPPKQDDFSSKIKLPGFKLPTFTKKGKTKSKSKKGDFNIFERKLKKIYQEIGL